MATTIQIAQIVFYTEDNRILLQDRAGYSKWGEEWAFFGGKIEDGETAAQAVVRETKEELDYDLGEYTFIKAIEYIKPNGETVIRHVFVSPLGDKEKKFTVKEGSGMRLYDCTQARALRMVYGDDFTLDAVEAFFRSRPAGPDAASPSHAPNGKLGT